MKSNLKKILITSIIGVIFGLMPITVSAYEISTGNAIDGANKGQKKVAIKVKFNEEETASTLTKLTLKCDTKDSDVECKFEYTAAGNITGAAIDKAITYTIDTPEGFEAGVEYDLGYLVLSNTTSTIKNSTEYSISDVNKTITLPAKAEEVKYNNDPNIKSIKFSAGTISPEFNPEVYEYTVYNIKDTIRKITLESYECRTGTNCGFKAITGVSSTGKQMSLTEGDNKVNIEFESDSGDQSQVYTFNIIVGSTAYNSAKLKSLSFGEYILNPAFDKDTKNYTLTVPNQVNSLINDIKYETEDTKANVSTEGLDNFVVGENKLTITVDNVTGSETITYTVTVKRMGVEDIEVIKYLNKELTFIDSEGIQSTLSEEEFKIAYPDVWKKILSKEIEFNEETGEVIVKENKKDKEVSDPVKKKKKGNVILIVLIIVVGLAAIVVSGILIFKKKKVNPEEETTEEPKEEEIDETNVEENAIKEEVKEESTMDIDEALSDLMSTKQYELDVEETTKEIEKVEEVEEEEE